MSIITSEARFRQRVIKYSLKYGVTKASIRFHRSRQAIYEWIHKYDGKSWKSLTLTRQVWMITFYFFEKVSPIIDNCTKKIKKNKKNSLQIEKVVV